MSTKITDLRVNIMYTKFEQIMNEKGYKKATVAKGAGIPYSTLTDWQAGRYVPKIDKLQKIADFLGVPVSVFLESEDAESVKSRVTDWHKAMATEDPDLYLFEKYKSDPEFMENIRLLFYLPPNRKQFVYDTIRSQSDYSEEDKGKEGTSINLSEVG